LGDDGRLQLSRVRDALSLGDISVSASSLCSMPSDFRVGDVLSFILEGRGIHRHNNRGFPKPRWQR